MCAAERKKAWTEQEPYLVLHHVSKYFQQQKQRLHVLDNIDFAMNKGEILCIVGASGCGKSTLLRAIAGLDSDHSGEVLIAGKEVIRPSRERGIVFQEHRLFPWLTVEQNVGYVLQDGSRSEKERLVQSYLELVGLKGFEKAYPKELSGGMAQRAGIARALVNKPDVLLLDEPFGALDAFTKIAMQKELKRIQRQSGTTMVMVTHDIEEAVFLADHVLVLSAKPGKVELAVHVELSEPRNRNSYEFLQVRKRIYEEFFADEVVRTDYSI